MAAFSTAIMPLYLQDSCGWMHGNHQSCSACNGAVESGEVMIFDG